MKYLLLFFVIGFAALDGSVVKIHINAPEDATGYAFVFEADALGKWHSVHSFHFPINDPFVYASAEGIYKIEAFSETGESAYTIRAVESGEVSSFHLSPIGWTYIAEYPWIYLFGAQTWVYWTE